MLDNIVCSESENGFWEIINVKEENRVELLFYPIDNSTNNEDANTHLTIKLSKEQLEDLILFCKNI